MSQQKPSEDNRIFAALAYILPVIGGIIGLIVDRNNPLTRIHAQQSISAVLTLVVSFIVWVVGGYFIGIIPFFGPIFAISLFGLVIAMFIFLLVNWIISLIVALRGQDRVIPFANRIATRIFGQSEVRKQKTAKVTA